MQTITIIGAGPAGLLLAHYLLSRGNYQVEIYERRPDPRLVEQSKQRVFPVSLQARGIRAIKGIPILEKAVTEAGIWSHGVFIHRQKGEPRQVKRQNPSLMIDRNRLTVVLLQELLNSYENELVKVKFDCNCVEVNRADQTVTIQSSEERFLVHFECLVGADGSRSQVREVLASQGDLHCQQEFIPDVYKSLYVSRVSPDKTIEFEENVTHTWSIERGIRLIMVPQLDNCLHGTLIFPPDKNPLENLTTAEAILDYFAEKVPSLRPVMTLEDAEALRQRPVSKILTVKCNRLNVGEQILLMGDAVHAVSPSIGQGCNAALQDAMIFAQVLDEYQDDWEKALPAFTSKRLDDVHALRDLSDYTIPRSKWMTLKLIFQLTVGKKLRPWFPQIFRPLPMELIMEEETPYSEVLKQSQRWINRVRKSMKS